ncbi:Uncharacterised protein [uncultured archaeon]|nr:Uncharacterised protein [uncultured archaeon]
MNIPIMSAKEPKISTEECIASARRARLPVTRESISLATAKDKFKIREYRATLRIVDSVPWDSFSNSFIYFPQNLFNTRVTRIGHSAQYESTSNLRSQLARYYSL